MQSTGHGATHKSQPVHSLTMTVCMCLALPRIASTGHAWMHLVQPMQSSSTISATTGSNTVKGYRLVTAYTDLVLPSATWKLGATITVAPTTGTVRVAAFGGDLT